MGNLPDEWRKIHDLLKDYYLQTQPVKSKIPSERNLNQDQYNTVSTAVNSLKDAVYKQDIAVIQKVIITIIETITIWIEIVEYRIDCIIKSKGNQQKSKENLNLQQEIQSILNIVKEFEDISDST